MTAPQKNEWLQVAILTFAVFAFAWFPFGFSLMFVAGKQLIYGFDDFPLGPMVLSFGFGLLIALTGLIVVYKSLCRGGFRLPLTITVAGVILSVLSVPSSRLMTRIEQERRYRHPLPNQPVGGNAGIASRPAVEDHWSGVPEPGRPPNPPPPGDPGGTLGAHGSGGGVDPGSARVRAP